MSCFYLRIFYFEKILNLALMFAVCRVREALSIRLEQSCNGGMPKWWNGGKFTLVLKQSDGHRNGKRKSTETFVTEFCYKSMNLFLDGTHKH